MTTAEFLKHLRALGIVVQLDGATIRCSAPAGVLTPTLKEQIAARKGDIVAALEQGVADEPTEFNSQRNLPRPADIPLSFAQQRLWFLSQLEPQAPSYTIAARHLLDGSLNLAAVAAAVTELVRRHESLRTTFAVRNGEPFQRIHAAVAGELKSISLETVPAVDLERVARDRLLEEARRPFALAEGPLFRPVLLRFGPDSHELAVSLHHIIADGWSLDIIAREVQVLYRAFVEGRSSPLPELPIQYADFTVSQRSQLAGNAMDVDRRYWRDRLRGDLSLLELQPDFADSGDPEHLAASHDFEIPCELADSIRELCRAHGSTLFMGLLSAFKALLSRYTGREDLVLGTPVANRTRVEHESVVGFFANTLVLRTDLAGDPTFRELMSQVREVCLGAYEHQHIPFEKVVEEIQPDRRFGRNPLFEISFVLQSAGSGSGFSFLTVASPFNLTLFIRASSEGALRATFEYRRGLFAHDTIARLARHLVAVLEGVTRKPDCRLSDVPLLSETEERQLLYGMNATAVAYPRHRTIHSLFREQAALSPHSLAVVSASDSLTYRQLDERSDRLARQLRALQPGPERTVGLWMERSIDVPISLLGILKAQGAYVPIDRLAPPARIAFMVRDAGVNVILTQEQLRHELPPLNDVQVICLDADWPEIDTSRTEDLSDSVTADGLAYVTYTSGSTGEPKGVAATHRNVVRLVKSAGYAHFGTDEVFLHLAPLSFDASTFEIWGALLNGGRLAIAPPGVLSVDEIGKAIDRYHVSTLWLTAGLFHQVVDHKIGILGPLRQLLVGGDALSVPHVSRVLAELPGCRMVNGYGPTEGTTFSCCYSIPAGSVLGRSVPIGGPIANTRAYVLDGKLRPVPIGVAGELWIAGDGLARGYVNHPELTAERFVTHRLSASLEERLYRSGDLVRWLADGTLEFLGRIDDQVKIRGYRIELREIEIALGQHPGVRNVAVIARASRDRDRELVAYVVAAGSTQAGEFREFLRGRLPEYMIPATFVLLDEISLTPNGKVDRRLLPEPQVRLEPGKEKSQPQDEVERQLVAIWQEVLHTKSVGTRDNFFDLGGHSLLAVRLFATIATRLGIALPLASLFQAPTIEMLATFVREGKANAPWRSLVPIRSVGNRIPVYGLPGVGGNVISYRDLAQYTSDDQPFYALQSRGLSGIEDPLGSVEEIAAAFIAEMREVRPKGPYILVGQCMGGIIAYEMAQQLVASGDEVPLLALIETWVPEAPKARLIRPGTRVLAMLRFAGDRFRLYREEMSRLGMRQRIAYVLYRMRMFAVMITRLDPFRGDRSEFVQRVVTEANLAAHQQYQPRAYAGRVVLFCAEGRRVSEDQDRRLAWGQLITGELSVHTLPGDDSGRMLMDPHVRILSQQFNAYVERAQAASLSETHA